MKKNTQQKDYTATFLFAACCLAILALQFLNFSSQMELQRSIDQLSNRVQAANSVNAKATAISAQQ